MKKVIAIICCLFSFTAFTQDLKKIEQDLLTQFNRIDHWLHRKDSTHDVDDYDSLEAANTRFQKSLFHYANTYPATLRHPFTKLEDAGLTIATSADGAFRIYSWDTYTGGTMKMIADVFQYKTNKKVRATIVGDTTEDSAEAGYWYGPIHTFKAGGRTYYLAIKDGVFATLQCYEGIQVFSISGETLDTDAKLIKTQSGTTGILGFEYHLGVTPGRKEDDNLIQWNARQQTITIPVVWEDGRVSSKNIVYKFTGRYFEKQR